MSWAFFWDESFWDSIFRILMWVTLVAFGLAIGYNFLRGNYKKSDDDFDDDFDYTPENTLKDVPRNVSRGGSSGKLSDAEIDALIDGKKLKDMYSSRKEPAKSKIHISGNPHQMTEQFAQLVNSVMQSKFFYPTEGFDKIDARISLDEDGRNGSMHFCLFTDCNLRSVAELSNIELDESQFEFTSDDTFLQFKVDDIEGIDQWMAVTQCIAILGREQVRANPKLLNVDPLVATLRNNLSGATFEHASTGFYPKEGSDLCTCVFIVQFKLHR